eukprot:3368936-Pleurochrysis_carterae.AAC.2
MCAQWQRRLCDEWLPLATLLSEWLPLAASAAACGGLCRCRNLRRRSSCSMTLARRSSGSARPSAGRTRRNRTRTAPTPTPRASPRGAPRAAHKRLQSFCFSLSHTQVRTAFLLGLSMSGTALCPIEGEVDIPARN